MSFHSPAPEVSTIKDILVMPPLTKKESVGELELHAELPLKIAYGHVRILEWNHPSSGFHIECGLKLISLAHYVACAQLYETLNDQTRSQLYQFLPVVKYRSYVIPKRMSHAISMIGNFRIDAGDIAVSHPQVLFYRWLLSGLMRDPNLTNRSPNYPKNIKDAYRCVWNDIESKVLIDQLCLKFINDRRKPFEVFLSPNIVSFVTISMPSKQDASTWYKFIPYQAPFYEELVSVGKLYGLYYEQWTQCSYNQDDIGIALGHIGCKLSLLDAKTMVEDFVKAQRVYADGNMPYFLENYFIMSSYEPDHQGSRAQLVSSTDGEADWQIHLSNSEANIGFLFNPCADFIFTPNFKSYARRRRSDVRVDYAKKDCLNNTCI